MTAPIFAIIKKDKSNDNGKQRSQTAELTHIAFTFLMENLCEVRTRYDYEAVSEETTKSIQKAAKTLWKERQQSPEKSTWEAYKEICNRIKREFVPKKMNNRQTWMAEGILQTMEERRKLKKNTEKYQIHDKRIKEMCM